MNKLLLCFALAWPGAFHSFALASAQETARGEKLVRLSSPRVLKLGWDTSNLLAADLNRDGLPDLVMINNGLARIDLAYQLQPGVLPAPSSRPLSADRWQPELEDALFQKASVTTGQTMHALAVGDFNGDERPDLAYTNDQGKLVLRFQNADESWTEKQEIELPNTHAYPTTLIAADLNGDGKLSLLALTERHLWIFDQHQGGIGSQTTRLPLADATTSDLTVFDIDGDGQVDILYRSETRADQLLVRRRLPDGSFGREEAFAFDGATTGSMVPFLRQGKEAGAYIARINAATRAIDLLRLRTSKESKLGLKLPFERFAVPVASLRGLSATTGAFSHADRLDAVFGDGEGAQIWLLESTPEATFRPPVAFPTYGGIADVCRIPPAAQGQPDRLLVISPREKAAGLMVRETYDGPFSYPIPLPCDGTPQVGTLVEDAGPLRVAIVTQLDRREAALAIVDLSGAVPSAGAVMPLKDVKGRLTALRSVDINQDGRSDLFLFSQDEPLRILLQTAEGKFEPFADPQGLSGSLVDKIDASAVSFSDVDGNGKVEALIAGKRLARAIRITPENKVETVAQFNMQEEVELAFAMTLPSQTKTSPPDIVAYDRTKGRLLRLTPDDAGMLDERGSLELPLKAGMRPLFDVKTNRFLLVGQNELLGAFLGDEELAFHTVSSYVTDLENVHPRILGAGALRPGREPLLFSLDSERTRVLEILSAPQGSSPWRSHMFFRVFESDPHYRGKRGASSEPREMLLTDLSGNGASDLVFLVHDRMLVYFAEPLEAK